MLECTIPGINESILFARIGPVRDTSYHLTSSGNFSWRKVYADNIALTVNTAIGSILAEITNKVSMESELISGIAGLISRWSAISAENTTRIDNRQIINGLTQAAHAPDSGKT
jgi:hypothetical protein